MANRDDTLFGTPAFDRAMEERFDDRTAEVVRLSSRLCSIPGVSVPAERADLDAIRKTCAVAREYAEGRGLRVYELPPDEDRPYPFLVVTFVENDLASDRIDEVVALIGHLDVVPARGEGQFAPFLRKGDLYARGAADMKTVVATYLVWMAELQRTKGPRPPFVVLLSACEENGSHRPHHARSAVEWLRERVGVTVRFGVVGERTGELEWMGEDIRVGPICAENRSWRWIRAWNPDDRGLPALERIAAAVALCRTTVGRLNDAVAGSDRAKAQPGLRSGFLNPFAFVSADEAGEERSGTIRLVAERKGGASIHSAVADVRQESLVERFHAIAHRACETFGRANVRLCGVEIGQEGNFNTYDGSGRIDLEVSGIDPGVVRAWIRQGEEPAISLRIEESGPEQGSAVTVVGLDIRELLDHAGEVKRLLGEVRDRLWGEVGFQVLNDCPPWRCPGTQEDLARLHEAYRLVVGTDSPDLVKLHGNDGGNLVAWQHRMDPDLAARGEGHAVIFGQVGRNPHGPGEFHRGASIRPYLEILDRWAASYS